MKKQSRWSKVLGACIAFLLVGAATVAVTYTVLAWLNREAAHEDLNAPSEVELPSAILNEPNDFVADLRAAAWIVHERWAYAELRQEISDVDVDRLEREALLFLGDDPDESRFRRALRTFAAGLEDGHAGVVFETFQVPAKFRWPFTLVEVREGLIVNGLDPALVQAADEGAVSPALSRGDLLIAVDEQPVQGFIDQAEKLVCRSTDSSRRKAAIWRMARFDEATVRHFRFRSANGEEVDCQLALPPSYKEIESGLLLETTREHRLLESGIGYLRPGDFLPPTDSGWPGPPEGRDAILNELYSEFDRIIGELSEARALILDLRGNPGGTDLLGHFLIDRLVEPGYVYGQLSSRRPWGWSKFFPLYSSAPPGTNSLRVPLICLIDEDTFSTADNVVACLADVHPDVRFVGRPNGAGSGAPRDFVLPRTGARMYLSTMRVRSPAGRSIEGLSLPLDSRVTWTREDVLQSRDPDLDEAIQLLESR